MTKLTRKNKNIKRINVYDSDSTIGAILSDPFYYGILVQAGQQVDLRQILPNFKPMLTEEQFGEVQAKRGNSKKVISASIKAIDDKTFIPFRQLMRCGECGNFMHVARSKSRTGKKYLYFRCGDTECKRKQKSVRAQIFLDYFYNTLEALHFGKKEIGELRDNLNDYINVRHNELLEEKLRVNAAIKAKKRTQGELAQAFIDLDKDAPGEAKKLVKEQMNECRDAIAALQAERDDISAKIYDPGQVREILEELTNQLNSLADKMKSADSWQKDQLVRKLVTNLEINNKNEVSFRWKKPLENVFNQALKNRTRFGARDWT